jgi:ABC-2 type transport system permease protein
MTMTSPLKWDEAAVRPTPAWAFWALCAREVRILRRGAVGNAARILMQPLLFVFVFSYVMPNLAAGSTPFAGSSGPTTFATVLVPGMVASALLIQGMVAVIIPLVGEFSGERAIQDRILAPLPVWGVALQKVMAGAFQALLGAAVVFPVVAVVHARGQAPQLHVSSWPLLLFSVVVGAVLGAGAGLLVGTLIDPRQTGTLFSLVVLPVTMLGCVYYPWPALEHVGWLRIAVLANPLVYLSEALRAALTPQVAHMPTVAFLLVLPVAAVLTCLLGVRTFARRALS